MQILSFLANVGAAAGSGASTGASSAAAGCGAFMGDSNAGDTLLTIISIAKIAVRILQILVPIALIVWGTIDIGKAVIAGDEKKIKEAQKPFVKRVVAAIIVFLIPWLVSIVLGLVGGTEWKECWNSSNGNFTNIKKLHNNSLNVDTD